jgi:dethiobiotin synthetase
VSYFITGTDTGVGKTLISCALLAVFAGQGKRVAGFKPVAAGGSLRSSGAPTGVPLAGAAGCDADGRNEDAVRLLAASTMPLSYELINPYCFREFIAPHIAAHNEGTIIELPRILAAYRELAKQADVVIVEGAGGFLVPLNDTQNSADLAREMGLSVILVVGMRLGCLSHALLTAEAIDARGLTLAGWVANILDNKMSVLQENIAALRERIAAPLLGVVPYMAQPDAKMAAGMLDLKVLGNRH